MEATNSQTYADGSPATTEEAERQQAEWDAYWAGLSAEEQEALRELWLQHMTEDN